MTPKHLQLIRILAPLTFVILATVGYVVFRPHAPVYPFVSLETRDVSESIHASGVIQAGQRVDLAFERPGRISAIHVNVGDTVHAGQVIAELDHALEGTQVAQAQAALALRAAGSSATQVQVSSSTVDAAQTALSNAKASLTQTIAQQKQLVANAYASLLNSGLSATANPSNATAISPIISGTYTSSEQGVYRISLYNVGGWHFLVNGLETATGDINTNAPSPMGTRGLFIQFPVLPTSERDSWTITIPNTQSSLYVTNQNAYQSALATQQTAIITAQNTVTQAQATLDQAMASYANTTAPARDVDLGPLRAALASAQVAYSKTRIVAPMDGVITQKSGDVGGFASTNVPVISMLNPGSLQVELLVSETDVAKVHVGDHAEVTLDAYGSDQKFDAVIVTIDPSPSTKNGQTGYRLTLQFPQHDVRMKVGMTANAVIRIGQKAHASVVPARSVVQRDGKNIIFVLPANATAPQERVVNIGVKGDDGYWEVLSGLDATDRIIQFGS